MWLLQLPGSFPKTDRSELFYPVSILSKMKVQNNDIRKAGNKTPQRLKGRNNSLDFDWDLFLELLFLGLPAKIKIKRLSLNEMQIILSRTVGQLPDERPSVCWVNCTTAGKHFGLSYKMSSNRIRRGFNKIHIAKIYFHCHFQNFWSVIAGE